ncbi:uncharacterized protein KQ657_004142 [Scheffersomyces spartinae]|uniref:Oligomycin resistance ATP-dependent permease YOR1 n=1 Tax=Scheffersomyces spartinae TaxID=45513 RepID=A0A9P8AJM3_9ASCO|nr:uncharacterized protein KQ657_004142 [Scheffersomyces spartinae]KAG7195029.1 hypothetical protein KQ657_004142 [Scheffersomyces spartinae]
MTHAYAKFKSNHRIIHTNSIDSTPSNSDYSNNSTLSLESEIPMSKGNHTINDERNDHHLRLHNLSHKRLDSDLTVTNDDIERQGMPNSSKKAKRMFSWMFTSKIPPVTLPQDRKPYPWKSSNFLWRTFFWWFWPILYKGYLRTLEPDDLFKLTEDLKVENMHSKFEKNLSKRIEAKRAQYIKNKQPHPDMTKFEWSKMLIPLALFDTFRFQYTMSCIYLVLAYTTQSVSPLITRRLIDFVTYRYYGLEKTVNNGVAYSLTCVVLISLNGLLLNHFWQNSMTTGAQAKAVLTKSLLLKSMRMSNKARQKFPIGNITSLMATDLSKVDLAFGFAPVLFCFPIPVIIAVALLLTNLGVTSLVGIGLFVVSLVICSLLSKVLFAIRTRAVKYTDQRISLMREVLSHLKVIKFYAWEEAYRERITKIRDLEMKELFKLKVVRDIVSAYALTLPFTTSMITFVVLWATDSFKSPGKMFASLSLFGILAQSIMLLPLALSTSSDAMVGFERLRKVFQAHEYDSEDARLANTNNAWSRPLPPSVSISCRSCCFNYGSLEAGDDSMLSEAGSTLSSELKEKTASFDNFATASESGSLGSSARNFPGVIDLSVDIQKGSFVMITGIIGSGKTTLLNALGGLVKLSSGSLQVSSEPLLCSNSWIQNATFRDNITFGRPFDHDLYKKVLFACALEDDLALLPSGDLTEIGERGVTLSGGQKARLNLARAAYHGLEIMLFDDILSAVDVRVGKHIVRHLFGDLLRGHTIVLATHQISLVSNVDQIIFLNGDGTADVGNVQELKSRNQNFRNLIVFAEEIAGKVKKTTKETKFELYDSGSNLLKSSQALINGKIIQEEEKSVNAISASVYTKYITLGSGIIGKLMPYAFLFAVILATFTQIFTNTWLSYWVEKKFKGKSDKFYVSIYIALTFITVFLTAVEFVFLGYVNNVASRVINISAVNRILHVPSSFLDTTPMGRILNRFSKDTDALDNELGEQLRLFIFPMALIIGIIILCGTYLPYFLISVPFLAFAFVFISNFYQGSGREIKRLEAIQRSKVYNNFNETLTGMATIKAFKAESMFLKKNDEFLNRMNEAYLLTIANQRWLCVHLDFVAAAFAAIISLLCVTGLFNISPSSTGLLINYVIQIVGFLSLTVRAMTQAENEMNSVERLYNYAFNIEQEPPYKIPDHEPAKDWPYSGYIQFENVTLRYRPNLPVVLKNLNFSIYPGEKVGICGRTGAGKSSIMTALYRLANIETGTIRIDGLDITKLGLYDLRSRLSIIPQDPVLFQGTIRKNLDPFNDYDDEVLWSALRRAGLLDYLTIERYGHYKLDGKHITSEDLPKFHLDQVVDDEGVNFSLGERQLLALARALVSDTKILILDEATSLVDYVTDSKIQKTIAREFKHCTILCIAHRMKTILDYDRILVMDGGKLIEKGSPYNLYKQEGVFRLMCDKANVKVEDF